MMYLYLYMQQATVTRHLYINLYTFIPNQYTTHIQTSIDEALDRIFEFRFDTQNILFGETGTRSGLRSSLCECSCDYQRRIMRSFFPKKLRFP